MVLYRVLVNKYNEIVISNRKIYEKQKLSGYSKEKQKKQTEHFSNWIFKMSKNKQTNNLN